MNGLRAGMAAPHVSDVPRAYVYRASPEPPQSTQSRPSVSWERSGSPLRQASQAQAGDVEFENFRCHIVNQVAKSGDGQLGVDGKHSTEFGACLVKASEMGIGGDFDPHRCDGPRLVVQGAVGPFDRCSKRRATR